MTREELDNWFKNNYTQSRNRIKYGSFIMSKIVWDEDYWGETVKSIYNYFDSGHDIDEKTLQNLIFVTYRNLCFHEGERAARYDRIDDCATNQFWYDAFEDEEEENELLNPDKMISKVENDIKNHLGQDYLDKWLKWKENGKTPREDTQEYFDIKLFLRFKYKILPQMKQRKRKATDNVVIFNPVTCQFEASAPKMSYLSRYNLGIANLYKRFRDVKVNGEFKTFPLFGYLWDVRLTSSKYKDI